MKQNLTNFKALIVVFCSLFVHNVCAQETVVQGTVTDQNAQPLMGATIVERGTDNGTVTNMEGEFTFSVSSPDIVLEVSYSGMVTQTIGFSGNTNLEIVLQEDIMALEETVVIGYGTVQKKDLTGAVSVVEPEKLQARQSTDIAGALKGMASGIRVTSSGQAGSSSTIVIRGIGNLTNNNPLFVIDGLPTSGGLDLNIQDIESIQILKDASAAAIYGSRAANGVVIITTKKGKKGPLRVQANAQWSFNWLPQHDLLDAEGYKRFNDMAYEEAIKYGIASRPQNHFPDDTDWQDEMLRTGLLENYNISLSGGSDTGTYFVSANKLADEGTLYGTSYDRFSFRVNTTGQRGIFSFGENFSVTTSETDDMFGNPFANFISMPPTIPIYDETNPGGFGYGDPDRANTYALNPIAQQELWSRVNHGTAIKGNMYGQVSLFDVLDVKLNFGYENYSGYTNQMRKEGNWTMGQGTDRPWIAKDTRSSERIILENTYNYSQTFGNHDIDALGGITYQTDYAETAWLNKLDPLVINGLYYNSLESATGTATGGGGIEESALVSYFGRLNYSYADKYLISATVRKDGTSRLPSATRWGTFPSIAAAWRISEEQFFNSEVINNLKIRANYGILGNANIGLWDYLPVMNNTPGAIFGSPEYIVIGTIQSQLVNNDLEWEKKVQMNFGVDASFLRNKLMMTADYFISEGQDLLVALPLLGTTGNNGGNPYVNAASLRNKGFELDLTWRDNVSDFNYSASLNFTSLRNEVLDLGYGREEYYTFLSKSEIGEPLGSFFLYKTMGIFQSVEEINGYTNEDGRVIQPNAVPGDIIYDDFNGDGMITSEDRQITGNPWPKFELGLNLSAEWRNFDVLVNGNGRFDYDVYNGARATAGDFASNQNNFADLDPWTPTNTDTDQPRLIWGDTRNSRGDQDRWLEDGSFFRISEIALGYTLPTSFLNRIYSQELRLGLTFRNLITFTNYSGLDPEFRDAGIFDIGVDSNSYPNPKSVLLSLSYKF